MSRQIWLTMILKEIPKLCIRPQSLLNSCLYPNSANSCSSCWSTRETLEACLPIESSGSTSIALQRRIDVNHKSNSFQKEINSMLWWTDVYYTNSRCNSRRHRRVLMHLPALQVDWLWPCQPPDKKVWGIHLGNPLIGQFEGSIELAIVNDRRMKEWS